MARIKSRKYNHSSRILNYSPLHVSKLSPGMMVSFNYNSKKTKDKIPLVLPLFIDKSGKNNLLHCINLNYLPESEVQKLYKQITKITPVSFGDEEDLGEAHAKVDLGDPTKKSGHISQKVYESVIKPKLLTRPGTSNCYRTYNMSSISNFRLVNYRLDIMTKEARDITGITKGKLSDKELHKNLSEGENYVHVDNRKNPEADEK